MPDTDSTEVEVASPVGNRPWERRQLCRELATETMTHAALAKKYGLSRQAITAFKKRHAREVDDIRAKLDDQFAGLWIAQQEKRIAAYQEDYELSANSDYAGHYEQIRTRAQLQKNVAEELGQIQGKQPTVGVVVQHVIVGVDVEDLK